MPKMPPWLDSTRCVQVKLLVGMLVEDSTADLREWRTWELRESFER